MDRRELLTLVAKALGRRSLIWAGIRGDDIEPISDLPNVSSSFSIIGRYHKRRSVDGVAFEDLTGIRVDLETWNIDDQLKTEAAIAFRRALLHALAEPSALLAYRPSRFLSAATFARRDRCIDLSMFGGHQSAFEHKPWVETSIAGLGVPTVPWTYIADEEQLRTRDLLSRGPLMLRRSRTSGGEGIVRVDDPAELVSQWPHADEAFVSVSPYLEGLLPVNVGATVWSDGVTVHYPSVQLIGIPDCVRRPFGYCGNDFGRAAKLDPQMIDQIESTTVTIGDWLRRFGYLGTFGVDYLIDGETALFTEINPRFQGSTHASCRLSVEAGEGCLILEHMGAMLGVPAPPRRPLRELVTGVADFGHLVVHWTGDHPQRLDPVELTTAMRTRGGAINIDVLTRRELLTEPGGVVARITVRDMVTETGFDLADPWAALVRDWNAGRLGAAPANHPRDVGV